MFRRLSLVAAAVAFMAGTATAQTTYTWTGAGNANWATASNWDANGVPLNSLANSNVVFQGPAGLLNTVDLLQGSGGGLYGLNSLTFNAGSGTFNITPSNTNITTLNFGAGGITNNSTVAQTISNPLALGANQSWTTTTGGGNLFVDGTVNNTGRTLTFAGGGNTTVSQGAVITGGVLVQDNSGVTTLSANNTPTSVTVNQGTLVVNRVGSGSPIGAGPVTLSGGTLSFRVFGNPVSATGYNHDVVTAISEFGAAPNGSTRAVDGNTGNGAFVYFQAGVNTANPTFGLPANGRFTSGGVNYQFQDYTGNNVLSFGANTPASAATTLTLDTPGQYRSLNIANVTGSGSSVYSFTLNFSDATSTTVTANPSPDWFNGTTAPTVFQVNGRLNRNTSAFDSVGSGNPRIYATAYTLNAADQLKTLQSIAFATTTTGTYTFNVFGFSGTAGADTQAFANNILVTGDTTLDQQNVSSVTLGGLNIGSNTLTKTGTGTTPTLTLGATTLTGNPTFSPAASNVLALGAVNDGGTARTITKAGAGVLNLTAPATSLGAGTAVAVTAGTLNLNAAGAVGTQAAVTLTGGTVGLGANQTFASLAGTSGVVAQATNTLTVGGGTAASFAGSVGGGPLVVTGANTVQTLTGAGTMTTTTIQNGGKLAAGGPLALGSGVVTLTGTGTPTLSVGGLAAGTNVTGFGGNGTGFNLQGTNGVPTAAGDVLTLTTATGGLSTSAFYATPVTVARPFTATFRYSQANGANPADGATFTIQNQSATAIGVGGGGLGYQGITNSAALALNIFGTSGLSLASNGVGPGPYAPTAPVSLTTAQAGNEVTVALSYNGSAFSGTLTQGANVFTIPTTAVNLGALVGSTGFIGFTGGTGGLNAQQTIDQFVFDQPAQSTYTAPLTVTAGTTGVIAVAATATVPTVTLNSLTTNAGSMLTIQAEAGTPTDQAYGLTFGAVTLNGPTILSALNNGTGTGTLTVGAVAGAGNLSKMGAGTLTITGVGTYTGTTTVAGGTLALTGTGSFATSPTIDVQMGATLNTTGVTGGANFDGTRFAAASGQTIRGTGTVVGPLGVLSGATVKPGGTVGRLTVTGDVVFQAGSTFAVQLNGTAASTTYDQLRVGGNVDVTGATLAATLGYTPATGDRLFVLDNTGTNPITGTFAGLANGATVNLGTRSAQISYFGDFGSLALTGGNDIVLYNFQPVPEPATVLGLAAVGLAVGRRIRRRVI